MQQIIERCYDCVIKCLVQIIVKIHVGSKVLGMSHQLGGKEKVLGLPVRRAVDTTTP